MEFLQAMHLYSAVYICRRGVRPRDSTFCVGVLDRCSWELTGWLLLLLRKQTKISCCRERGLQTKIADTYIRLISNQNMYLS